jgi:group I intron endonuclease
MIGIYKITNPKNQIYIGQSKNIEKRLAQYKTNNAKAQPKLYDSFLKYGVENHSIEIICECEILELNEKERFYQDLYFVLGKNGLNLVLTKAKNKGVIFSEETKLKIKITRKKIRDNKKVIPKKINSKNIFFPLTGETFFTAIDLYNAHKEKFYSYNSLIYNIRNNKTLHIIKTN